MYIFINHLRIMHSEVKTTRCPICSYSNTSTCAHKSMNIAHIHDVYVLYSTPLCGLSHCLEHLGGGGGGGAHGWHGGGGTTNWWIVARLQKAKLLESMRDYFLL